MNAERVTGNLLPADDWPGLYAIPIFVAIVIAIFVVMLGDYDRD